MEVLQNLDLGVDWIIKVDYVSTGALIVRYINTIIIGVQHMDAKGVYMIIYKPVICR